MLHKDWPKKDIESSDIFVQSTDIVYPHRESMHEYSSSKTVLIADSRICFIVGLESEYFTTI